jgi:hypothetical protein
VLGYESGVTAEKRGAGLSAVAATANRDAIRVWRDAGELNIIFGQESIALAAKGVKVQGGNSNEFELVAVQHG